MKIKQPTKSQPKLNILRDLLSGRCYRDIRTGNIWLCAIGGYVNLTKDQIVTRYDNMPGNDDIFDPRYETIECTIEMKDE